MFSRLVTKKSSGTGIFLTCLKFRGKLTINQPVVYIESMDVRHVESCNIVVSEQCGTRAFAALTASGGFARERTMPPCPYSALTGEWQV